MAGRRTRSHGIILALMTLLARSLSAQTQDEARLVVGIAIGRVGTVGHYDVPNQPIVATAGAPSAYHLNREFYANVTASGHVTYFPNPRAGLTLEFTYVGLGTADRCVLIDDGGDVDLQRACAALDGTRRSPVTSEIQVGFVIRPLPQSIIQPYLKAQGGVAFTPNSAIQTVSAYRASNGQNSFLTVYLDDSLSSLRPAWTAAVGFSSAPHTGYQVRIEFRETWMHLTSVSGPTAFQGLNPPTRSVLRGFRSIVIGFDVVLARQRGRRY